MNLSSGYLGLSLKSPLVVGASPLTEKLDNIKIMEDSGAAAVVMHSLFEEQIIAEQLSLHDSTTAGTYSFAESLTYFPEIEEYRLPADEYLTLIQKAKHSVGIPIIASLNGDTVGGWCNYAKKMEEAGADAVELNIYSVPSMVDITAEAIENSYLEIVTAVKSNINIPIAVKLAPFFSNPANMAKKLSDAGVNGLVLFNRFYQPDIDLDTLEVHPHINFSSSSANKLAMRWIAILKDKINCDFAATGGIHTSGDVIKMILSGANIAMLCSELIKHGIGRINAIEKEMIEWMDGKGYESVNQMLGSMSQKKTPDPSRYERSQYVKTISGYKV
ncbi:MAG: dihydroorotate oxidase [Ignavibacteria bacterium]|nr:dihydroorotate oxidase [Ignavibacteria bacterium]